MALVSFAYRALLLAQLHEGCRLGVARLGAFLETRRLVRRFGAPAPTVAGAFLFDGIETLASLLLLTAR